MAPIKVFQRVEIGTIAAGQITSKTWTSDDNYTLHSVIINEKGAAVLNDVYVTLRIKNESITRDKVPCNLFTPDYSKEYVLDIPISKGTPVDISIENTKMSSVTIDVVLVLT
jgi:hypothetical protein